MTALGHKRTSRATPIYVRYWGLSGHPMSAFSVLTVLALRMSAIGGKADVRELLSVCPLIAKSGHSVFQLVVL